MNPTASSSPHGRHRRAIAAHFAGRAAVAAEAEMRAHLPLCASCRHLYERHLLMARLDPRALPAADRLARGLGFRLRPSGAARWRARLLAGLAVSVAAASVLAIVPAPRPSSRSAAGLGLAPFDPLSSATPLAPVARGAQGAGARAASFWTYRIGRAGIPELADRSIARGDELAFAYANPTAEPFLMIFGVDEHRHVYWFHPAWPVGRPAPVAVRAAAGPGPHELPDAILQAIDGQSLAVYAAFSARALGVEAVEAAVRQLPSTDAAPALGAGVMVLARRYEVRP